MNGVVVIPTYNEAANIERLVREIFQLVPDLHVLVVDDQSPDGTADLIEGLQESYPHLHLLRREGPRSFGKSYIDGFKKALDLGARLVIQMDADFSHNPRYLMKFLELIEGCDVIIGSRYTQGVSVVNWPIRRLMLSLGANTYVRWIAGLGIMDATSGYKCWRREVLEALDLDGIRSNGYAFQIETVFHATRLGFNCQEAPIIFIDRTSGTSKISRKMVREAMLVPWKLRLNAFLSDSRGWAQRILTRLYPLPLHVRLDRSGK